ncbi:bifunctional diguanylate cyclase/phosphodiesterase [Planomonospora sp. ID67723]|uniref:putative bifunctional diguanylate cyclase/phosphodiesterase n=1 Tax=Planomonospora sp. ID67723 TaxID=2738134 RepID=UPI0018C365D5|nr:bifunctional diguanylate cyclase/phosphodiesterase [Planomonospora sp. ID67723]MBG0831772.1 bifunctional diguanylate cyclase/phosphodiesterase [Planomonospora sp. ID67723]
MSQTFPGAALAAGARLTRGPHGWLAFLVLSGLLALAAPFLASLSPVLDVLPWVLLQGATALAVIVGIRRHDLNRQWSWRLIAAANVIIWLATTVCWGIGWVWLEIPFLLDLYNRVAVDCRILTLIALVMLGRRESGSSGAALLDAGIVTVGVAMPVWAFLLHPMLHSLPRSGVDLVLGLATPITDLFVVGLAARLALSKGRAPWLVLLSASYGMVFIGDSAYLLDQMAGRPDGAVATVGWLAWSVLIGAAALHPSLAHTGDRAPALDVSRRGRVTTFLILTLLSPMASMLQFTVLHGYGPETTDKLLIMGLTVVLAVLLVLRLNTVARLAETHAAALDRQTEQLTRQTHELSTALHTQELLQRSLSHRASHDPLTGLANRTLLGQALHRALNQHQNHTHTHTHTHSQGEGHSHSHSQGQGHSQGADQDTAPATPPALLLLDLDDFKDVNDSFGHPIGDDLIIDVAHRLRALTRPGHTLARLGGDEFALLMPATDTPTAQHTADAIRTALAAPYRLGPHEIHLTTSIGILAEVPVATPAEALRDADLALYAAKAAGKNQTTVFDTALRTARLEHTRLSNGLRHAQARGELSLAYQPVVDLRTGRIHAVEALLRWQPATGRPIPPDVFIPIAEDTGLIVDIGLWALQQACADAARWHTEHGLAVTVNISGRQLREPAFAHAVLETLARHRLPEHALILEITESMLLATTPAETSRLTGVLSRLRAHGVRIALDDFGTGYSSLAYLRTLPVDILKIDRSFTTPPTAADHAQTRAFTKAILELSASLHLQTIVEGVETPEQAVLLQQMGCPLAQGYLFSPPADAHQIDDLLQTTPGYEAA